MTEHRFPPIYPEEDLLRIVNNVKAQHRPSFKPEDWDARGYYKVFDKMKLEQTQWLEHLDTLHNKTPHRAAQTDLSHVVAHLADPKFCNTPAQPTASTINTPQTHPGILDYIKGIDRVDFDTFSPQEFRERYEFPSIPVIIKDSIDDWPSKNWTLDSLSKSKYSKAKFRIGDDDDGRAMRVPLDLYLQYLDTTTDDSPLYLFEDDFGERPDSTAMLEEYSPPKYFREDLFLLTPLETRPPFRWIIAGKERTGTKMHIDPLGSSAWNALQSGRKRWICFSPKLSASMANGSFLLTPKEKALGRPLEAIEFFDVMVPRLRQWITTLPKKERQDYCMVECIQYPGETIFVPNGWHHAVYNLDDSIAFTQNWASIHNFLPMWKTMCVRRRHLARRLFDRLAIFYPDLAHKVEAAMKYEPLNKDEMLYEPQNDPEMRPRRLTRYKSKECLQKATKEAMDLLTLALPDLDERLKVEGFKEKAMEVMLQGNIDSSDTDSDEDDETCHCGDEHCE